MRPSNNAYLKPVAVGVRLDAGVIAQQLVVVERAIDVVPVAFS